MSGNCAKARKKAFHALSCLQSSSCFWHDSHCDDLLCYREASFHLLFLETFDEKKSVFAVFPRKLFRLQSFDAAIQPFMSMSSYKILIKLCFMSPATSHRIMCFFINSIFFFMLCATQFTQFSDWWRQWKLCTKRFSQIFLHPKNEYIKLWWWQCVLTHDTAHKKGTFSWICVCA